ncbi:unnamed protein product [marine sediment metagenome]|uniref:Uncharacterized protein n=1 Tax=marine sediment metagenome TaxID=412755 RepID=X1L6J6_9ZZZZ
MPADKIQTILKQLTSAELGEFLVSRCLPARFSGVLTPAECNQLFMRVMAQKFKTLFSEMKECLDQGHVGGDLR